MLCEKCGKNDASVFVKKEIDSIVEEYYICSSCASERELGLKLGLFTAVEKDKASCSCHSTFEEISQSGYVGCPKCYITFKEELLPIIATMHGHTIHKGKIPLSKTERLEVQIQTAIENKFFDLARKLQSKLDELKGDVYE